VSVLTTSEGVRLAGHRLGRVSGVCPRQADRPGAAQLLSMEPFIIIIIIIIIIMVLWSTSGLIF